MHLLLILLLGCDTDDSASKADDSTSPSDSGADTAAPDNACTAAWDQVTDVYADAGTLGACGPDAAEITGSLLQLSSVVIDAGQGTEGHPCVQIRCDETYAYIATNALPHWDWSALTVRQLDEDDQYIHRIPLQPTQPTASNPTDIGDLDGCVDAYNQLLLAPSTGTTAEPAGYCAATDLGALRDGDDVYAQLSCTGATGFTIGGPPTFGPNEVANPDPWGSPVYYYPELYSADYGGDGPALDACGFHGHQHAINAACFEVDDSRVPDTDYAAVWEGWDLEAQMNADCSEASGIVGWSYDGYPIKGPCVCTQTNDDGSCAEVRRARSAWMVEGLGAWSEAPGAEPDTEGVLAQEGAVCSSDTDCCGDAEDCRMVCALEQFPSADAAGSVIDRRCVVRDYSWCTHQAQDTSSLDVSAESYVYLDRCNGYDGPDGYAYHTTWTFPYIQACYRGQPTDAAGTGYVLQGSNTGGGGGGGGGGGP